MFVNFFNVSGIKNLPSLSRLVGIISEKIEVEKSSCSSEKKSRLFIRLAISLILFTLLTIFFSCPSLFARTKLDDASQSLSLNLWVD